MDEVIINRACPANSQCMKWINVKDGLPSLCYDVIACGYRTHDVWSDGGKVCDHIKEIFIESGFRSEVDDPKNPHEWADFSFHVTHWMNMPRLPDTYNKEK